jgi:probable F420-dependent oxidoreductase
MPSDGVSYVDAMRYGLYAMNYGSCAEPDNVVRVAAHAEAAGFESLWTGEHFALPDPKPDWFTMEPTLPYLDAIVALTLMATHTETIKIAAGVFELPLHSPVMLAKQLTGIDHVSNGRLLAGVGVGYLEAEYAAFGVPLSERGSRTDEYIDAMRALWTMPAPEYRGRHVTIAGVDSHPRPVQPGGPPIIIGGLSDAARHRAVTRGNGWFVYDTDVPWVREAMAQVADESERSERRAELGRLELTVIPPGTFDPRAAEEYEAAGVSRIVLTPQHDLPLERRHESVAVEQILRMIDTFAAQLLGR